MEQLENPATRCEPKLFAKPPIFGSRNIKERFLGDIKTFQPKDKVKIRNSSQNYDNLDLEKLAREKRTVNSQNKKITKSKITKKKQTKTRNEEKRIAKEKTDRKNKKNKLKSKSIQRLNRKNSLLKRLKDRKRLKISKILQKRLNTTSTKKDEKTIKGKSNKNQTITELTATMCLLNLEAGKHYFHVTL